MAEQDKQQPQQRPAQHQDRQPGIESKMQPQPVSEDPQYRGSGKLRGKATLITGGDSGIGRAVAILFAKEGADVAIVYLNEHADAKDTQRQVEAEGRRCVAIAGDIGQEDFCRKAVEQAVRELGRLDILVNNASIRSAPASRGRSSRSPTTARSSSSSRASKAWSTSAR